MHGQRRDTRGPVRSRDVTSVDLDEDAIRLARTNANLNQTRLNLVHADAFAYLRQMIANDRRFDVVVLDPPKFASSRLGVDDALRKYHDLNTLAMGTVRPGGILLTCSCTGLVSEEAFTRVVHGAAARSRRSVQMFDRTSAGPDHPVMFNCPESAYLKALWVRLL